MNNKVDVNEICEFEEDTLIPSQEERLRAAVERHPPRFVAGPGV